MQDETQSKMKNESMAENARNIAFRLIGYGMIHIIACLIYILFPDSNARLYPLITLGSLLFSFEIYWKFLRKAMS